MRRWSSRKNKASRSSKKSILLHGVEVVLDSGLEKQVLEDLLELQKEFLYHPSKINYTTEPKNSTYTPDLQLPNGIFIEIKGYLRPEDIKKHILIKQQHPELDIRFIFQSIDKKITGRKHLTYAGWCEKNGFLYAQGTVPTAWYEEILNG